MAIILLQTPFVIYYPIISCNLIILLMIDTPKGLGTQDDVTTYFSAIRTPVTLTLTVRSYPEPTFTWSKDGVNTGSTTDNSIGNDEFQSSFEISSVGANHYGNYTVVVRSDGRSSFDKTFIVQLKRRGRFSINIVSFKSFSFYVNNLNEKRKALHKLITPFIYICRRSLLKAFTISCFFNII